MLAESSNSIKKKFDKAPDDYVTGLFDYYARAGYTDHMLQSLRYRGHELVCDMLYQNLIEAGDVIDTFGYRNLKHSRALAADIGCGSGLVGKALRQRGWRGTIIGNDLSSTMIKLASESTYESISYIDSTQVTSNTEVLPVYDSLHMSNCISFLTGWYEDTTRESMDVVLAGDVICYMGSLEELFRAVYAVLSRNGLFVFSTEALNMSNTTVRADYVLQNTARYAHNLTYVSNTACQIGFTVLRSESVVLRTNGDADVDGNVFLLVKY